MTDAAGPTHPAAPRRLVVTGGGSGIGRAVCELAVRRRLGVVALDRDDDALVRLRESIGVATVVCDVGDERSVEAAMAASAELLGGVPDALVAAAGVYDVVPSLELSAERFESTLRTNLVGAFLCARALAQGLVAARTPGAIVLLSSIASGRGDAREPGAHYTASKGAVVSMTRQLAAEWAAYGIRVNAVSPGVIRTPMLRLGDDASVLEAYLDRGVPMRRLGEADEVAHTVLHLIGPESSYTTGAVIPVDGGSSAV